MVRTWYMEIANRCEEEIRKNQVYYKVKKSYMDAYRNGIKEAIKILKDYREEPLQDNYKQMQKALTAAKEYHIPNIIFNKDASFVEGIMFVKSLLHSQKCGFDTHTNAYQCGEVRRFEDDPRWG